MTDQLKSSIVFQLELGVLVRRNVIFQIRSGAQRAGVECEVIENKGIFDSEYQIRIIGPTEKVHAFRKSLNDWLSRI